MKIVSIVAVLMFFVTGVVFATDGAPSFEDQSTPMEEQDMKSLDEVAGEPNPIEDEATPMEDDDMKSLDEIKDGANASKE